MSVVRRTRPAPLLTFDRLAHNTWGLDIETLKVLEDEDKELLLQEQVDLLDKMIFGKFQSGDVHPDYRRKPPVGHRKPRPPAPRGQAPSTRPR